VAPDSVEARNMIPVIRDAVHKIDKDILVGGGTAVQYDTDVGFTTRQSKLLFRLS
jgi:putative drug exporter of the RND superfamily